MPEDLYQIWSDSGVYRTCSGEVTLDALDEDALIRILKEPKNSLTKQYQKIFELDGVNLNLRMMH